MSGRLDSVKSDKKKRKHQDASSSPTSQEGVSGGGERSVIEDLYKQYDTYKTQFDEWVTKNKGNVSQEAYDKYVNEFKTWEKVVFNQIKIAKKDLRHAVKKREKKRAKTEKTGRATTLDDDSSSAEERPVTSVTQASANGTAGMMPLISNNVDPMTMMMTMAMMMMPMLAQQQQVSQQQPVMVPSHLVPPPPVSNVAPSQQQPMTGLPISQQPPGPMILPPPSIQQPPPSRIVVGGPASTSATGPMIFTGGANNPSLPIGVSTVRHNEPVIVMGSRPPAIPDLTRPPPTARFSSPVISSVQSQQQPPSSMLAFSTGTASTGVSSQPLAAPTSNASTVLPTHLIRDATAREHHHQTRRFREELSPIKRRKDFEDAPPPSIAKVFGSLLATPPSSALASGSGGGGTPLQRLPAVIVPSQQQLSLSHAHQMPPPLMSQAVQQPLPSQLPPHLQQQLRFQTPPPGFGGRRSPGDSRRRSPDMSLAQQSRGQRNGSSGGGGFKQRFGHKDFSHRNKNRHY